MMMGVMEIMVMIMMVVKMRRHMVETDRQERSLFFLSCMEQSCFIWEKFNNDVK